ncbi:HNH endonuclease [Bacillus cereus]|uniref:HNH endonuclease n=1 Tax=Bacillus cereus TaxID=1396 RepID=UPI0003164460
MAEFVRKKRYYKYRDKLCKKYLRIDFKKKCAYCGMHEAESIIGLKIFQIDHFRPQKLFGRLSNNNDYENLFYSCEICNGINGKSDNWNENLLNPCIDDIYGEGNHIIEEKKEDFKLIPLTEEGRIYIETIKLNQKKQRQIRKTRNNYKTIVFEKKEEITEALKKIEMLSYKETLSQIKETLEKQLKNLEGELVGPYFSEQCNTNYFDEEYEDMLMDILNKSADVSKVYDDYGLDFKLEYKNFKFKCYLKYVDKLSFNQNGEKCIRISVEQIKAWIGITELENIIVFVIDPSSKKVYFTDLKYSLSRVKFNEDGTQYTIYISKSNELKLDNVEDKLDGLMGQKIS